MESLGLYLLKSAVWLTGFTLVFLMVLRNERYFQLNRAFLLSGIFASIVLPLYTWHYAVILPSLPAPEISFPELSEQPFITTPVTAPSTGIPFYWWLYGIGIAFLAFRLMWQTIMVIIKLRRSGYVKHGSIKLIRTPEFAASFSFFSFVFVNPSTSDIEMEEIVNHESGHIQKRHWFDLLLVELLRMLQWFNPFVWIYAHLVRQNHEYMADEMALQRTSNPAIYHATLLNQMLGMPVINLANSFNYSLNKKRFKMMKKKIDSPFRKLRMLLVLPLVAMVFYAFAKPEYITPQTSLNEKVNIVNAGKDVKGNVSDADGKPLQGANPGKQNGKSVDVNYVVPMEFSLKSADVKAKEQTDNTETHKQANLIVKPSMGIQILPRRLIFEGTKKSIDLKLINDNKDSVRYTMGLINYQMSEDGSFREINTPGPNDKFADKYLNLSAQPILIGPEDEKTVNISLTGTGGLTNGEYRSHLYFRSVSKDEKAFGYSIPVIIRIGELSAKVILSDIKLEFANDIVSKFEFTFNRSGDKSVYGDLQVNYISTQGKSTSVGNVKGIALYAPNLIRRFNSMQLKNKDGINYHSGKLQLIYSSQENNEKYAEAELTLQ